MDEFSKPTGRYDRVSGKAGYAEWIALGAVIAGSVGALVGAAKYSHACSRSSDNGERPESATLTAPHGDKLGAVV